VRIGTVTRASRRQKHFEVTFDGDERPSRFSIEQLIKSRHTADKSDVWSGDGVAVGDRIEEVADDPSGIVRLTGERVEIDQEPEPKTARGIDSPEKFMTHAKTRDAAGRRDMWLLANGFEGGGSPFPLDPDGEEELIR
jgi:hypothetical protein